MRFSQADAAVDEKRVLILCRMFRHGNRCRMGKLIGGAYDEPLEAIVWIQRMMVLYFGRFYRRRRNLMIRNIGRGNRLKLDFSLCNDKNHIRIVTDNVDKAFPDRVMVIFDEPVLEKSIRHGKRNLILVDGENPDRLDPGFKILL